VCGFRCWLLVLAGTVALVTGSAHAAGGDGKAGGYDGKHGVCSATAKLALKACRAEARDDLLVAVANCINLSDRDERRDCKREVWGENAEFLELCEEQFGARREVCALFGEGPYDPDFDPQSFELGGNSYFPLAVGNEWKYLSTFSDEEGGEVTETIIVRVLEDPENPGQHATKDVEGVTCLVVNDVVEEDGEVIEDTDDWYARHLQTGDVWYCGELARDYETFEGDMPAVPELVSIDGSFKAGRDGDKAGILVPEAPNEGQAYRQEFSLGNAEDVAQVLATEYVFGGETGDPESLDYLVPKELAEKFCSDKAARCLVTRDFTPLEPDVEERKYRAPGIGVFLEVNLTDAVTVELVECNFDNNCPLAAP
jgi:hypothetical protein